MNLVLGAVQFGLPYGITNRSSSRPANDEIEKILSLANENGVSVIDTAATYGESESVLGQILSTNKKLNYQVITKLLPLNKPLIDNDYLVEMEAVFEQSHIKLHAQMLYGVMVHREEDLLLQNSDKLYQSLEQFKSEGKVKKIGCSFYHPEQLFKVLERFDLEIVQIPMNIFDQRFLESGALELLRERNIEVYVRSLFLQGLLLTHAHSVDSLGMNKVKPYLLLLDRICKEHSVTRLELVFNFINQHPNLHYVFGFNQFKEFKEVLECSKNYLKLTQVNFKELSVCDESIINPSLWKRDKVSV